MKPFISLSLLGLASAVSLGAALHPDDNLAPRGEDLDDTNLPSQFSDLSAIDDFPPDEEDVLAPVHQHPSDPTHLFADDDEDPTLTIYQLISQHPHTTKWTALVDEHHDLVELLNGTKAHHTVFVPDDAAFDHHPFGEDEPSKEWVRSALEYHIAPKVHTMRDIAVMGTLPTILKEDWLAGKPQRLRPNTSIKGFRLNFFTKIIGPNKRATNGIVHIVNKVIHPPTMVGRELSLVPSLFSTLLLAYEKTDFVKFIHHIKMEGSTVFAPTNRAFARLGPKANAFLFNTDKGKVILKALLKYQIAANVTLYSDAVYGYTEEHQIKGDRSHSHYDLDTLLQEKRVAVDVERFGPWVSIKVNRRTPVVIRDVVAKNGVIQAVGKVPIPPHKHHHDDDDDHDGDDHDGDNDDDEKEISVKQLIDRLWNYLDEEEQQSWSDEL